MLGLFSKRKKIRKLLTGPNFGVEYLKEGPIELNLGSGVYAAYILEKPMEEHTFKYLKEISSYGSSLQVIFGSISDKHNSKIKEIVKRLDGANVALVKYTLSKNELGKRIFIPELEENINLDSELAFVSILSSNPKLPESEEALGLYNKIFNSLSKKEKQAYILGGELGFLGYINNFEDLGNFNEDLLVLKAGNSAGGTDVVMVNLKKIKNKEKRKIEDWISKHQKVFVHKFREYFILEDNERRKYCAEFRLLEDIKEEPYLLVCKYVSIPKSKELRELTTEELNKLNLSGGKANSLVFLINEDTSVEPLVGSKGKESYSIESLCKEISDKRISFIDNQKLLLDEEFLIELSDKMSEYLSKIREKTIDHFI